MIVSSQISIAHIIRVILCTVAILFFGALDTMAGNSVTVTRGHQPLNVGWNIIGGYAASALCTPSTNATPLAVRNAWMTNGGNSLYGWRSLPSPTDVGTFTFTCTHVSGAADTATLIVTACGAGTTWNPTTLACVTTPTAGTLTAPNCTIVANQSTCTTNVSWTITNASSPSIQQNGTQFSTLSSGTNVVRTMQYGNTAQNTVTVNDVSGQLSVITPTASCAAGTGWNGTICAASPDLTAINNAPAAAASYTNPGSVIFTGTLTNAGTAATLAGQNIWADVEIDWNQASCAAATSEATKTAGGPWTTLAVSGTQPMSATLTSAASELRNGTHCYRMIADRGNLVTEINDTNNGGTPWRQFTISGLPECSDGIENDSDTLIDYPADPGCTDDTDTTEAPPPACNDTIDNDGDGRIDFAGGSPDAGCASAADTDESGPVPSITMFRVCDPGLTNCVNAPGPKVVAASTLQTLQWAATNATVCGATAGPGFATGNAVSGTDDVTSNVTPGASDIFTVACSYGTDVPVSSSLTLGTTPGPVLLTGSKVVVDGETATLTWDTNNGDETQCSLIGGPLNLSGVGMVNGTGDVETGSTNVTINGTTTFTLTCPNGTSRIKVEVVSTSFET
jgi:hypothetical protein